MDNKDGIVDAPHEPHDKASAGIRSRITVVCAECKRLKLKCDRRAPCSSCVKRETTARCVYSAAAAEKIDVQSLHNRVSALEESWRSWTNTQPGQTPTIPPPHGNQNNTQPPPPPPPPPVIVAAGPDDVASALVGLDDVSALWTAHLGLHLPHIPLRPSTPDDTDDDDNIDDTELPPSLVHARQIPTSSRTGVTRAHVQMLPPRAVRAALWAAAERAIGQHTGLAPRVRARFERMCDVLEAGDRLGPAGRTKWPLSLFAVGTAGLAIGAQVVAESDGGIPLPSTSQTPSSSSSSSHSHSQHPSPISPGSHSQLPCSRTLAALSIRALSPNGQDTDSVLAALLHAARGTLDGRPRIVPRVWPDVCRAVGVARGMGLGVDRVDGGGKDELADWRRRVWWEVYCADLFTSDYIGLPPSIDDATFSAALPKGEDGRDEEDHGEEDKDDSLAYFALKCRLAQLIKTLKRRLLDERPLPLEGAASMERSIGEFMRDLPPTWKLDMSQPASSIMGLREDEAAIMVQRCELATAANSLILKAYHPFLKQSISSSSEPFASPHQAALACSNAAHALIHASIAAHHLLPRTRPYAFAKQLFGGAVVAASVAINAPTGMFARVALDDVRGALNVLRELDMWCGAGGMRIEGVAGEAVRIVEVLVGKAESAMGVGSNGVCGKRKRGHDAATSAGDEGLGLGFEMPYVGPGVVTCEGECGDHEKDVPQVPPMRDATVPALPPPAASGIPHIPPAMPPVEPKPRRDAKPVKVSPYPRIGVRVRTNKPPGAKMARSRAGSSVNGERSPSGGAVGVPSQQPQQQPQQASPLAQPPQQPPPQTPSLQMTVPHQPPPQPQPTLQVITEQPPPQAQAYNTDYTGYTEQPYAMPYLMNTPATPTYPREFYGGYEYAPAPQPTNGMDMMMGEYAKDVSVPDLVVGEGQQPGWYRQQQAQQQQQASTGSAQQTQTGGPWNGSFDAPGWDTRR
ncbi:Fungal specific transcription factor domain [Ceratobasidium sp. AG-Ba]|nr:Fungal specific transcription factor domain [Ceratobasidium sp. AG-Ba]